MSNLQQLAKSLRESKDGAKALNLFNDLYLERKKQYENKRLPINLQELVDNKFFMTGFSELLKYPNIKQIKVDGKLGKKLGFTSEKFYPVSLLCLLNNTIIILFIQAKTARNGDFTKLIEKIISKGYDFEIIAPFDGMIKWANKNKESFNLKFYCRKAEHGDVEIISNKGV